MNAFKKAYEEQCRMTETWTVRALEAEDRLAAVEYERKRFLDALIRANHEIGRLGGAPVMLEVDG